MIRFHRFRKAAAIAALSAGLSLYAQQGRPPVTDPGDVLGGFLSGLLAELQAIINLITTGSPFPKKTTCTCTSSGQSAANGVGLSAFPQGSFIGGTNGQMMNSQANSDGSQTNTQPSGQKGKDCSKSTDGNGGPLPNSDFMKEFEDFFLNAPGHSSANPEDAASPPAPALAAGPSTPALPVLDLPFPALFPKSTAVNLAPCDPQGNSTIFFVNHSSSSVTRQLACSGQVVATISVASRPLQMAITPDGKQVLVTSFDNVVNFISPAGNTTTRFQTPSDVNPSGIAISPDGSTAYITSFNPFNPSLVTIDIAQRKIMRSLSLANYPQSVFLTPDGAEAWVTFPFGNAIYVVDTLSNTIVRTLGIVNPFGVAFNPTGTRAYISSASVPGTLQVVDTTTYAAIKSVPVGTQPADVLVSPDGGTIFVANEGDGSISVIDSASFAVHTFKIGSVLHGLAFIQ